ncbi:CAP domain-containing protein [Thalassoglobus sp.]|uniref:CAP domain-containing protein n=1 Tax=Thalassoglobus sp. TaxID=2795869 RepID=UPI003AA97052
MTRMKLRGMVLSLFGCAVLFMGAESGTESKPLTEYKLIQQMYASATNHRARSGMFAQQLDEDLCRQAQAWANNMANRNMMYHGGGEQVVGRGYGSPEACVQGWINSPGHRMWVLGGNARCGFGVQRSWSGQWYYAGVFR